MSSNKSLLRFIVGCVCGPEAGYHTTRFQVEVTGAARRRARTQPAATTPPTLIIQHYYLCTTSTMMPLLSRRRTLSAAVVLLCIICGSNAFVSIQPQMMARPSTSRCMSSASDDAPNLVGQEAFVTAIDVLKKDMEMEIIPQEQRPMYAIGKLVAQLPLELVSGIRFADCETLTLISQLKQSVVDETVSVLIMWCGVISLSTICVS